jgi:membrane protease YdiL (CAAX protease family)
MPADWPRRGEIDSRGTRIQMHWDFAVILIILGAVVPLVSRRRLRHLMELPSTTKMDRLALYASTFAFQWFAACVVLWRSTARGLGAAQLGLAVPSPGRTIALSVILSVLILANQLLSLRRLASHPEEMHGLLPQLALKIFPQDQVERLVFGALVATVALCEEFIYRGFAQRVFEDWSGGAVAAGAVGSAICFALAHLYQGRRGLASTFAVGLVFASVRAWTGSLLVPVLVHFVADLTVGFLAPSRLRAALAAAQANAAQMASHQ